MYSVPNGCNSLGRAHPASFADGRRRSAARRPTTGGHVFCCPTDVGTGCRRTPAEVEEADDGISRASSRYPISGDWITFLKTAADTNGELLAIELELSRDGHVPGAHVHPFQKERFEIRMERCGFERG